MKPVSPPESVARDCRSWQWRSLDHGGPRYPATNRQRHTPLLGLQLGRCGQRVRFDVHASRAPGVGAVQGAAPFARGRQAAHGCVVNEQRATHTQCREQRAGLARGGAAITKRRAEDYKDLVNQNFMSQHGYLRKRQTSIEQERDHAYQEARVKELKAAVEEARTRRHSQTAEFERMAVGSKTEADKKAAQLEQELIKAQTREKQQLLTSPVAGTVQQLAIHTIGGVVTPAQALMVIAPSDYSVEVEAVLENKDVGFVKVGQKVEVKVETFPFTRYGTLTGTVSFVSNDAVNDEKKGPVFQARVKLDRASLKVDAREVNMTPGMAVTTEIATGQRRLITFFLDPLRKTTTESLRER